MGKHQDGVAEISHPVLFVGIHKGYTTPLFLMIEVSEVMITICIREPQRGNEMSAQGSALGTWCASILRPERAKELKQKIILLPFQGEI